MMSNAGMQASLFTPKNPPEYLTPGSVQNPATAGGMRASLPQRNWSDSARFPVAHYRKLHIARETGMRDFDRVTYPAGLKALLSFLLRSTSWQPCRCWNHKPAAKRR